MYVHPRQLGKFIYNYFLPGSVKHRVGGLSSGWRRHESVLELVPKVSHRHLELDGILELADHAGVEEGDVHDESTASQEFLT